MHPLYTLLSIKNVQFYSGTLHSDKEGDTFSNHRENILKTAKTLVEDTKTLVGGAAGTQEQLATAAQSAVGTIGTKLYLTYIMKELKKS